MCDAIEKEIAARKKKKPFEWYCKIIQCLIAGLRRGWSNLQIANRLNEVNLKTARGKSWNENLVHEKFNVLVYAKKSHFTSAYVRMVESGLVSDDDNALLMTKMRK